MEFEWDPKKAISNLRKHHVSFEEASSVFSDALAAVYEDPDHSAREKRYLMIGTSAKGRLLNIAFADRGQRIRIISARKPTRREKKFYEEEIR
ncbi:MAG TPA: BrnT family toxin [Pyrinomonadaceae bacterium]|nr:BrnT family toxin [Pyrinomonadaceae bacterium]